MYERFNTICTTKGITPYKVSKETGISQTTLSQWKSGRSIPKIDKIQKIADYFNVPVEVITGEPMKGMTPFNMVINISKETGISINDLIGFEVIDIDYTYKDNPYLYEVHRNYKMRTKILSSDANVNEAEIRANVSSIIYEAVTEKTEKKNEALELFLKLSPDQQESIISLMKTMKK